MRRLWRWLVLLGYFVRELILGALSVAWLVVQPSIRLRPAFVSYPLTVTTDLQITLLAYLITLTPGTLSVDVSEDRKTLLIHSLDVADPEVLIGRIAAGFEARVLGVTR
jgi:multicomponent Na+:H+ antiporter subunit E